MKVVWKYHTGNDSKRMTIYRISERLPQNINRCLLMEYGFAMKRNLRKELGSPCNV